MRERFGGLVVVTLLVAQFGGIVRARFHDDRYFAWAPLHEVTTYELIDGVDSQEVIARRFAIPPSAWTVNGAFRELNAFAPMLRRIRRVACADGRPSPVLVRYRTGGRQRVETVQCRR